MCSAPAWSTTRRRRSRSNDTPFLIPECRVVLLGRPGIFRCDGGHVCVRIGTTSLQSGKEGRHCLVAASRSPSSGLEVVFDEDVALEKVNLYLGQPRRGAIGSKIERTLHFYDSTAPPVNLASQSATRIQSQQRNKPIQVCSTRFDIQDDSVYNQPQQFAPFGQGSE